MTRVLIGYALIVALIAVLAGVWSLWALALLPVALLTTVVVTARARSRPVQGERVREEIRW